MRPILQRRVSATAAVLLVVAACGRGSAPELRAEAPSTSPEHLESAPVVEEPPVPDVDTLVAEVERELAVVESVRERRAALARDLEEWRERARRLEEQVRAEREESEELRARVVALEQRASDSDEEASPTDESGLGEESPSSSIDDSEPEEPLPPSGGGLLGLLWGAVFGGDRDGEIGEALGVPMDGDLVVVPAIE